MKDAIKKVYPIILPPLCIIAGVLCFVFFFVGPIGKNQWDILAIGVLAIVAALLQIGLLIYDKVHNKNKK